MEKLGLAKTRPETGFHVLKLHLLINQRGELLSVDVTQANTDHRRGVVKLTQHLFGKLYADKGCISQELRESLRSEAVRLVSMLRKNMTAEPLSGFDTEMLKKRMLDESVIKELKTQIQLEHRRHRSLVNFQVNIVSALMAHTYLENKPFGGPAGI